MKNILISLTIVLLLNGLIAFAGALREIEHLIQVDKKELEETLFNDYDDQILNIINKTKGEPNE